MVKKDVAYALTESVTADYGEVTDHAMLILETLKDEQVAVFPGVLGTALAFIRLLNYESGAIGRDKEIQALKDLMDWAVAYFADTGGQTH